MFTLFSIVLTLYFCRLKSQVMLYLLMYGFSVVCFYIAIDGNFFGAWDYMYVKDKAVNSSLVLYYWMILLSSYVVFFVTLKNSMIQFRKEMVSEVELRWAAYFFGGASLVACFLNVVQAYTVVGLNAGAREWELAFGRYVVLNYIYFLHLLALTALGFISGLGKARFLDMCLLTLLLCSSTLHGIKFTILHAFAFFCFSYFIGNRERIGKILVIVSSSFLLIIVAYFLFARGGGIQGLVDYIISASVNSIYIINTTNSYDLSSFNVLNPLGFIPFDKVYDRLVSGGEFVRVYVGFRLNDLYNLEHAITKVGVAWGAGIIFYSLVFSNIINVIRCKRNLHLGLLFFLALTMQTILMFFTGFEFFKTKLWFNLILAFVFFYLLRTIFRRRNLQT